MNRCSQLTRVPPGYNPQHHHDAAANERRGDKNKPARDFFYSKVHDIIIHPLFSKNPPTFRFHKDFSQVRTGIHVGDVALYVLTLAGMYNSSVPSQTYSAG